MAGQLPFTLRQIDQGRADFAAIESDLQFVMAQLARVPTRRDLAKTALGIIFCSAIFTTLFVWIAKTALGIIFCSAIFTTLFVWIVWH